MPIQIISMRAILVCAVLLSAAACKQQQGQVMSGPPVVPVAVAPAVQQTIPLELRVVGTAEASAVVQVRSQVAGELKSVQFSEGQNVTKGTVLFEIDKRPYEDALRQAQAALSRDRALVLQAEATLKRDEAQLKNADVDAGRQQELHKQGIVPKSAYDQARTNAEVYRESAGASKASIQSARAAVENDEAAIDRAKLDISYCTITAPISGRTGNLLVHPGNLVKANDAALVVIHQVQPIFVSFSVPEQHLSTIRKLSAGRQLPVQVSPQDDPGRTSTGTLTVIDNTVDRATGTIRLKAVLPNADGLLWPGQFVNVTLTLKSIENATVVPSESVQVSQQGQFIYVVKNDKTVEIRPVVLGPAVGGKTVIEKGVSPGDVVVTDGQLRLFPGATIRAVEPGKTGATP